MKTKTIGFIGGGRITKIILQAFQNQSVRFETVRVYDPNGETLNTLKNMFPEIDLAQSAEEAAKPEIVVIAVHPPVVIETLEKIKEHISENTVVVSLAPKISIEKITAILGIKNIARSIPNATSIINEGYNPITYNAAFDSKAKTEVMDIMKKLGNTFEVAEQKLEAYAIISAMLPTYFWFQWKELGKLGVEMGLSIEESKTSLHQTLLAAINLLYNSGLTAEQVIDLIPVKPIGEHEAQISEIYREKLMGLFQKIKP